MQDRLRISSPLRLTLCILGVIAGFYALYFAGLGHNPLLDPDEPIYGQFVKEMVRSGDWLTPHYGGQLWFDKPPLFYWLSAASVKMFGLSEFAVRLPSAVCAVGIVLMVFLLTSHDFGKRAALFASLVMATSLMQIVMSHAAATDAVMVFLLTLALYCYRRWLDAEGRGRLGWITVCGLATGLGMLAKGPVVPVLLTAAFAIHLWWVKRLSKLKVTDVLLGVGCALAIGLPWYIAMYAMHGHVFVDQFIVSNNIARFLKPLHKSQTGQWYSYLRNAPVLLLFLFPWSVFLPQAIARNWRANTGAKLAAVWFAVVFVFFSISKTQNFTYTYPAFPAAALLIGALWSRAEAGDSGSRKSINRGVWVGLGIAGLIAMALAVIAIKKYPGAIVPAGALGGVLVVAFVGSVVSNGRKAARTAWVITTGMLALNILLLFGLIPVVSQSKSSEVLAHKISHLSKAQVVIYSTYRPGLVYYVEPRPIRVNDDSEIEQLMSSKTPMLFICNEGNESHIERFSSDEVAGWGDLDVYANKAYMDTTRTAMLSTAPGLR
ncbi:MAG: glycosyltransferase family 39 protein [Armatimonadota bacterium]|nr:glycosyltransferase family 39 protein [bacterium]